MANDKRVNGWERQLKLVIEKHSQLPSQYGISDCYMLPDDVVLAITGERMFNAIVYTNEIGAAKMLLQHGFKTVEDAFAATFERVAVSLAQRGDIGVTVSNDEICGGVFTSHGFVTRDATKLAHVPLSSIKSAFKVGRR